MNNLHFQDAARHTPARYDFSGKDEAPGIANPCSGASILWFSPHDHGCVYFGTTAKP